MYTYLTINILTMVLPVLLSFEKRIHYVKKWKYAFAAAAVTGFFFVLWDQVFTALGVWGFNKKYLIGIFLEGVPIEEILFFVSIPFAGIFIYEVVCCFVPKDILKTTVKPITYVIGSSLVVVGIFNFSKLHTLVVFVLLALLFLLHIKAIKSSYLGRFYVAYSASLIPIFLVNWMLANGIKSVDTAPVIWYNNAENLAIRVGGIPVENALYCMLLLLVNITLYEYFKRSNRSD